MQVNQCTIGTGLDCSTCRYCYETCPTHIPLDKIMPLYRYVMGKQTSHRNVFETISKLLLGVDPVPWLKDVETDDNSDVAYFPGCLHMVDALFDREKKYAGASQAGVKVLNAMGIKPKLIYGCCGHDLYVSGDLDEFEDNKARLKPELEGKRIVVGCPECYHMLKEYYDADVVYFTDFLLEKGVEIPKMDGVKVTYHDPCRLGRYQEVYDSPREVISKAAELVEMDRIKEEAQCCGVNSWINCNESSMEARQGRVEEAIGTGADYLVSGCTKCIVHFDCFNYDQDSKLEVPKLLDIQELVGWAMGVYDPENVDAVDVGDVKGKLPEIKEYERDITKFLDDELLETIFSCTTCERCTVQCYTDHHTKKKMEALRRELVKLDLGPAKHKGIAGNIEKSGNVFNEEDTKVKPDEAADVIYFPGCVAKFRMHKVYDATTTLLDAAGVKYAIPEGLVCCASVLMRSGHDASKAIEANTAIMRGKKVVVSCAGCYNTLKNDYEGIEVYHITEFMLDQVDKLKFKTDEVTVTYHDPCHLGRACGLFEEPRKLIAAVPGVKLQEYETNRENAECCGGGGGVKAAFPEKANELGAVRAKQAEDMGVDVLLTTCPFCKLNIGDKTELPMMDVIEFLIEHLE